MRNWILLYYQPLGGINKLPTKPILQNVSYNAFLYVDPFTLNFAAN